MKKIVAILLLLGFSLQACAPRIVHRNKKRIVMVKKAPRNSRIVIIRNKKYITWGGNYYKRTSQGYVLVNI